LLSLLLSLLYGNCFWEKRKPMLQDKYDSGQLIPLQEFTPWFLKDN